MVDPQGRLLAGTEPNGILYRITAKDKAFVLYDASLPGDPRHRAATRWQRLSRSALGGALAKKVQAAQAAAGTAPHGHTHLQHQHHGDCAMPAAI